MLFSACLLIFLLNLDAIRQIPVCIVVTRCGENFVCVILCDFMCMRVLCCRKLTALLVNDLAVFALILGYIFVA